MKKAIMAIANHPRRLITTIIASWLTAAFLFSLIESTSTLDALYWSMTTMSTVGYGDLSAATAAGKIMTIIFQAWSIFVIVPCAIAGILDAVRIDEQKYTHAEQEWVENSLKAIATKQGVNLPEPPSDY